MDILENDLCVRFWRVPFVALVFTAFVFVSGVWGSCDPTNLGVTVYDGISVACSDGQYRVSGFPGQYHQYGYIYLNPEPYVAYCGQSSFQNGGSCQNFSESGCGGRATYTLACGTQCEADSVLCLKRGEGFEWNSDNCTCDSIAEPDTTYRCQNGFIGSQTSGMRPIATLYRCISTGSSSDQCVQTGSLNGTCQDWGWCGDGAEGCDIPPDGGDGGGGCNGGDCGCTRSGGSYTRSAHCYYQCLDGSSRKCSPTSTEYVAGNIYVGSCPPHPPAGCGSSSSGRSSSSSAGGSSSSLSSSSAAGESSSSVPRDSVTGGIDYSAILDAIRDTLHRANAQREGISGWDVQFLKPAIEALSEVQENTFNNWRTDYDIDTKLSTYQANGFNLTDDIKSDLDSARLLLDEINDFLAYDSVKTYSSDTTYNPLLRDIKRTLDSSGSSGNDSAVYGLLRPYFADSGQWDSPITRALNTFMKNFGRDSSDESFCSRYYACLREGTHPCVGEFPGAAVKCTDGGSPMDGVLNTEIGILDLIRDAIFGDDTTDIPSYDDDGDTTDVLPPVYSSASSELQRVNDSLSRFDISSLVNSVNSMVDSARRASQDTTKIQPDSLWLDSSQVAPYVDNLLLPSGTGTDCFICSADLGTFGGLSDTSLKVYIDFSDFGGYNWCAIIRAVVRIATLVTCISLTLGSWAAAFGYNPKNDA